jgi:hypothetical protein
MARMNNELFHFLVSRNIFKNYLQSLKCSEKTEQRRKERHRQRLVWLSKGFKKDSITGLTHIFGKGTYIKNKHGMLK